MQKRRDKKRNHETIEERRGQLQGLPVIRRHIAGIDLGSEQHWVCAPTPEGNGREIAAIGGTTPELIRLAEWLKHERLARTLTCNARLEGRQPSRSCATVPIHKPPTLLVPDTLCRSERRNPLRVWIG
jgi:hypothetical protein